MTTISDKEAQKCIEKYLRYLEENNVRLAEFPLQFTDSNIYWDVKITSKET